MSEEVSLVVRGPEDVVSFLDACGVLSGASVQVLLGLAVTESDPLAHTICGAALRSGADAACPIDGEQLVDLADELLVGAVVLATVEPGTGNRPERPELTQFVALRRRCADAGVVLLDWIVCRGERWWSLRELVIQQAA